MKSNNFLNAVFHLRSVQNICLFYFSNKLFPLVTSYYILIFLNFLFTKHKCNFTQINLNTSDL